MEAVIFVGLQASGKSSFYKDQFFSSHVRLSLDLLRTRHRERRLLDVCLDTQQSFVIDNTNPSRSERAFYIEAALRAQFQVVGYYFCSRVRECLIRNRQRENCIPDVGLLSTAKKLERPSFDEGFHQLHYVRLLENRFVVEEWNHEI